MHQEDNRDKMVKLVSDCLKNQMFTSVEEEIGYHDSSPTLKVHCLREPKRSFIFKFQLGKLEIHMNGNNEFLDSPLDKVDFSEDICKQLEDFCKKYNK